MFTGIVETVGTLQQVVKTPEGGIRFCLTSSISCMLKPGQSVSHNGVCLTVVRVQGDTHWVTAVQETVLKSNFGLLQQDKLINLERSMRINDRFDGHIVQGHVDQTAICAAISRRDENVLMDFTYDSSTKHATIEKGSIAINGVSLTCFNSRNDGFTVTIVPYTLEHTNFSALQVGEVVNLEFDVIGKYVQRLM